MHSLQVMLEVFAFDHQAADYSAFYPQNIAELTRAAQQGDKPYWKALTNPYTEQQTVAASLSDYQSAQPGLAAKGQVLYKAILQQGKAIGYEIYGVDHLGHLLKDKAGYFYFSSD